MQILFLDDIKNLPMHPNCGISTPVESYRIKSGKNATHGEHPWFAILNIKDDTDNIICGGSLINTQFVLTGKKRFKIN